MLTFILLSLLIHTSTASRTIPSHPADSIKSMEVVECVDQMADCSLPITIEDFRQAEATLGNPDSKDYNEEAFCKIISNALNAGILGEADKMRAQYRLEIAAKNRPGNIAADFSFSDRDDDTRSLHSLKTDKPILLVFYDPDCDHCMQTLTRLRDSDLSKNTQVVAIYAEEDRDRWEETAPALPEKWIVGFALDPIQDDETYIFLSSPAIYLLSQDKKVILKDTNLDAVEKTITPLSTKL